MKKLIILLALALAAVFVLAGCAGVQNAVEDAVEDAMEEVADAVEDTAEEVAEEGQGAFISRFQEPAASVFDDLIGLGGDFLPALTDVQGYPGIVLGDIVQVVGHTSTDCF